MTSKHEDSVAIIAMNGRFPGAETVERFWDNLKNGVESVKFFTQEELINSGELDEHLRDNPKFVSADAVLEDMDKFDATFFDFSAREAEILDPQHRLFLEAAWEAMESAGYDAKKSDWRFGVFAGSALSGYMVRNLYSNPGLVEELGTFKTMLANDKDFLSTRVSYKLDFMGPSVNVNTLCSSSLVAVHMACHSLLDYHCDVALAGGVSFQISRNEAFFYQEGGIGSSDGHCRAFDAKGDGTVSGSGLAIVVLKRLEDAVEDGDVIHAVIRGTGMNNDGASKNSYTAPNPDGQAECIAEALSMANVDADTISYLEAHGTGTNLGDPIEIAGLTRAYRSHTDRRQYCPIGSVKTNIGHLVTAGGAASLIKTVMSMKHRQIPASLNFETPNPKIDWENCPFYVNTELSDWETLPDTPMRAGVSSFGIGGTNVHLVVEESPVSRESGNTRETKLLTLSAKSENALKYIHENLREFLTNDEDLNLADVCFTHAVGRRDFGFRRSILFKDREEVLEQLGRFEKDLISDQRGMNRSAVFVFADKAELPVSIIHAYYQTEASFAGAVDEVDAAFRLAGESSLKLRLLGQTEESIEERIRSFAIQYAIGSFLSANGVAADLMIGEGCGELVAIALSQMGSLSDLAALLVANDDKTRAQLELTKFQEGKTAIYSLVCNGELTVEDLTRLAYWETALNCQGGCLSEAISAQIGGTDFVFASSDTDVPLEGSEFPYAYLFYEDENTEMNGIADVFSHFWSAGGTVDWNRYYASEIRNRIELPTYPFERRRYWIDEYRNHTECLDSPSELRRVEDSNQWFYRPTWKRLRRLSGRTVAPAPDEAWAVFDDGDNLSSVFIELLRSRGANFVRIEKGSTIERVSDSHLRIDVGDPAGFDSVVGSLKRSSPKRIRCCYFWADTQKPVEAFIGLTNLLQAVAKGMTGVGCSIVAITRGAFEVVGRDGSNVAFAAISALCKLAEVEFLDMGCCHVDLDPFRKPNDCSIKLAEALLSEANSVEGENVVAYRGNHRWGRLFERVDEKPDDKQVREIMLKKGGSYVITGGLGGVGMELAERLAEEYQARIAMIDNRNFPGRELWSKHLASNDSDHWESRTIKRIQSLEANGELTIFASANVGDFGQFESAISKIEEKWGRIDGIFSCAGSSDEGGILIRRSNGEGTKVLKESLRIIDALERTMDSRDMDFALLFSGIGVALKHAEVGRAGALAAYEVFDAFAERCSEKLPFPVVSVNWSDWKGAGQTVEKEELWRKSHQQNEDLLFIEDFALLPCEGWDALKKVLAIGLERVAVCTYDLNRLCDLNEGQSESAVPWDSELESLDEKPMHPRPSMSSDYVAAGNEIEERLAGLWQKFLRIEKVGMNDNFFELGGDSLLAVHLMQQVSKVFQVEITASQLFEGPTVATLARIVAPDGGIEEVLAESVQRGASRLERRKVRHSRDSESVF